MQAKSNHEMNRATPGGGGGDSNIIPLFPIVPSATHREDIATVSTTHRETNHEMNRATAGGGGGDSNIIPLFPIVPSATHREDIATASLCQQPVERAFPRTSLVDRHGI